MTRINVRLTIKELELLAGLASDQLFRREFIDHRLPGAQRNPDEIGLGKQVVAKLQSLLDPGSLRRAAARASTEKRGRDAV